MRIGQAVKFHLGAIFTYCESVDHGELDRLLSPAYSKATFGLNFPFCAELGQVGPEEHKRYWTQVYLVRGMQVRATSQWFEPNGPLFADYLVSRGIVTRDEVEQLAAIPEGPTRGTRKAPGTTRTRSDSANARYRGNAIGNAQNAFVRNVLSNLGYESFNEKDWANTKAHFGHRCAYCGVESDHLLIEHAIPINKVSVGEHRLGNLVPSCRKCNADKGSRDFRAFLKGNDEAITRIEEYMDTRNYVPLDDNEQVTMVLGMAHKEVAALASRYVTILNELFVQPATSSGSDEVRDDL